MISRPRSTGTVVGINLKLLGATLLAFAAWALWPSSPEWWAFGLLSILIGASASGVLIDALRAMAKLYARDKALVRLMATGAEPRSSKLASDDALRQAGVIND